MTLPNSGSTVSMATMNSDQDPASPRACQECHRKKTKCDMRRPVCGLCARTETPCDFPSMRKRPTRPITKPKSKLAKVDDHLSILVRLLGQEPSLTHHLAQLHVPDHIDSQQARPSNVSDQQHSHAVGLESTTVLASSSPSVTDNSHATPFSAILSDAEAPVAALTVPRELALHLVDTFFEKVAPWLPLLHRPSFVEYCVRNLCPGHDSLANLPTEYVLLLLSMFSLSARYSPLEQCWTGHPRDRGILYAKEARRVYAKGRTLSEVSLRWLQGSLVLAYHFYSMGMSHQGWVLVGVCVRFALDLGLSDLDGDSMADDLPTNPVEAEELRRAWWLVWELDTFGSITLTRPFAVDRRHVRVKLPISDEAWFAGESVESETLRLQKGNRWNSLRASPNQDARAWYLISYGILAKIYDRLLLRESISLEARTVLENEISCLKLALPAAFHAQPGPLSLENGAAANNWIVGIHLFLSTASHMIFILSTIQDDRSTASQDRDDNLARENFQVLELSSILRMWPPSCISTAHPFLVMMLCPMFELPPKSILQSPTYQSLETLVALIQEKFGEYWDLGQLALSKCLRFVQSVRLT